MPFLCRHGLRAWPHSADGGWTQSDKAEADASRIALATLIVIWTIISQAVWQDMLHNDSEIRGADGARRLNIYSVLNRQN